MVLFHGFQTVDDVAVDVGPEAVIEGGADERGATGLDTSIVSDAD